MSHLPLRPLEVACQFNEIVHAMSLIFYTNVIRNGRVTVSSLKGITTKVVVIMGQRISNHDGNVFSNGLIRTPLIYK